ncbi:hypothetical protein [Aurantiacibacter marinus]|uniref:Uncharacterized protein n=1 Tax=Aurantiacibacter marinus TaxID=874156 RepID=A0A0H0XPI3_9SPHN|nr:hypothetical protein [Aurantiacibacter marinus]KLI63911.1 hypothetical protein AAV99_09460 [Aurantiacibacter marinus]
MPYEPYTHDPEQAVIAQRERLYWLTLVSGLGNIAALVLHWIDADDFLLSGVIIGSVAGSLLVAAIRGRTDGYYQDLVAFGTRCTAFALGVFLLLLWADNNTSLFRRLIPGFETLTGDAYLLALILGLVFHAGYAFAYLRDLITSKGD